MKDVHDKVIIEKGEDGINDKCPKCGTDGGFIYDEVMDADICSICGFEYKP